MYKSVSLFYIFEITNKKVKFIFEIFGWKIKKLMYKIV